MTRQGLEQETPFAVALNLHCVKLTDQQFYQLCQDNEDLRLELTAEAELIIMPPTGGKTGSRNADITSQITIWAKKDGAGLSFDSSTMFCLPNGAKRSPDAAWVRRDRWDALTEVERESFVPLCPDFVLELLGNGSGVVSAGQDAGIHRERRAVGIVDRSQIETSLCLPSESARGAPG